MNAKLAVVTGASSGIGAATARALLDDGWEVIIGARRTHLLEQIPAQAHYLDVTDDASVVEFASHVQRCDLLVNNAGGALGLDSIADANLADWQTMYDTNVLGTLRVTRALLPALKAAQGLIVNISSVAGLYPYAGGSGYNAAKFGVTALNKVMRIEFAEHDLRITEINPGRVHTDFSTVRFKGDEQQAAAVYADKLNLTAADIAEAIRWVAAQPPHVNIDRMIITPRDQVF